MANMNHYIEIVNPPGNHIDRFLLEGFSDEELLEYFIQPRLDWGAKISAIKPEEFNLYKSLDMTIKIIQQPNKVVIHYPYKFESDYDAIGWKDCIEGTGNKTEMSLDQLKLY